MKLIFSILTWAGSFSQAYEGFRCVPSTRETRLQVLVQNDEVQVLVVNPAGYVFMPQFEGPQSVFNLSFNRMQGEDLKDLGDSFIYSWPKSSCHVDATRFTVDCHSEAKGIANGIKSYGLKTSEIIEKSEAETYEKRKFRFSLEKENFYFVSLQYGLKSCEKFN